jgi:hypothetical protein
MCNKFETRNLDIAFQSNGWQDPEESLDVANVTRMFGLISHSETLY